ncbi:protein-glutamate O-methyltransferase CheR [Thalassolituus sp.]|jgi:chemotaxis protein methyltransferase CheR|uniref:CheR family methyltransferase n=1 Tax=Thalassolituus sp. TaxID=2030822 RepID=UPI0035118330
MGASAAPLLGDDKEFLMTAGDFDEIAELALKHTGIVLGRHKANMVYGRIARRLRQLGYQCFADYLKFLRENFSQESTNFINLITTNLTSFYREPHHFEYLEKTVIPGLKQKSDRKVRIWSSGCSIGQEAYTIAFCLGKAAFPSSWDVKILATDLDSNVLDKGRAGIYPADSANSVPQDVFQSYLMRSKDQKNIRVKDSMRNLVHFKRLNLLEQWPMKGQFDVIFCRNVVIYFNRDTQKKLFNRYADFLPVGGHLFIGHSESLNGLTDRFESVGNTIYRKKY